jgi:mRNA interferase MazF
VSAGRGEVWLVDFGDPIGHEQAGRRPAVIISADGLNHSPAGVVIVVPCTTTPRGLPSHVELDPATTGLSQISYAKCEDVKSVSARRLISLVGRADPRAIFDIERAVRYLLDL